MVTYRIAIAGLHLRGPNEAGGLFDGDGKKAGEWRRAYTMPCGLVVVDLTLEQPELIEVVKFGRTMPPGPFFNRALNEAFNPDAAGWPHGPNVKVWRERITPDFSRFRAPSGRALLEMKVDFTPNALSINLNELSAICRAEPFEKRPNKDWFPNPILVRHKIVDDVLGTGYCGGIFRDGDELNPLMISAKDEDDDTFHVLFHVANIMDAVKALPAATAPIENQRLGAKPPLGTLQSIPPPTFDEIAPPHRPVNARTILAGGNRARDQARRAGVRHFAAGRVVAAAGDEEPRADGGRGILARPPPTFLIGGSTNVVRRCESD